LVGATVPPGDGVWLIHAGERANVMGVRIGDRRVCAKVFHDDRAFSRLRTWLGFGRGRRACRRGRKLNDRGSFGPRVLAYAERRPAGPGVLVMDLLGPCERLDFWLKGCSRLPATDGSARRRALATKLGTFTGRLHRSGAVHDDYSTRNLFVDPDLELCLVDYEDLRFPLHGHAGAAWENIRHLHADAAGVPLRDRLRFLRAYAAALGLDPSSASRLARRMPPADAARHGH
jgi:hypothetical protein